MQIEKPEPTASELLFEDDQEMEEADPDAPLTFGQGKTKDC